MIGYPVTSILDEWGEAMANIGHNLMIKYGLRGAPSSTQADAWVQLTETFIRQGYTREEAGKAAARQLFPDFNTHTYASQADDIESLLDAAKRR